MFDKFREFGCAVTPFQRMADSLMSAALHRTTRSRQRNLIHRLVLCLPQMIPEWIKQLDIMKKGAWCLGMFPGGEFKHQPVLEQQSCFAIKVHHQSFSPSWSCDSICREKTNCTSVSERLRIPHKRPGMKRLQYHRYNYLFREDWHNRIWYSCWET